MFQQIYVPFVITVCKQPGPNIAASKVMGTYNIDVVLPKTSSDKPSELFTQYIYIYNVRVQTMCNRKHGKDREKKSKETMCMAHHIGQLYLPFARR